MSAQLEVRNVRRPAGRSRTEAIRRSSRGVRNRNITPFVLCVIIAAATLIPIYVLLSAAFSGRANAPQFFLAIPGHIQLSSFVSAYNLLRGPLLNSVAITVPATALSCLIGAVNGLIFAHFPFRHSDVVFIFIMVGMFIPYIAIIIPLFLALNLLGIQGGVVGLIVTNTIYGLPICTLIFRNYYAGLPKELLEAARVDGAGFVKTFVGVVLPLSGPGFVVALVLQFTNIWNNFLFGFILASPSAWPAPVALNNMIGDTSVNYSVLMAGALMVALPSGVLYLLLSRFFVRGLTAGAMK